jgi:hypothetical protein
MRLPTMPGGRPKGLQPHASRAPRGVLPSSTARTLRPPIAIIATSSHPPQKCNRLANSRTIERFPNSPKTVTLQSCRNSAMKNHSFLGVFSFSSRHRFLRCEIFSPRRRAMHLRGAVASLSRPRMPTVRFATRILEQNRAAQYHRPQRGRNQCVMRRKKHCFYRVFFAALRPRFFSFAIRP